MVNDFIGQDVFDSRSVEERIQQLTGEYEDWDINTLDNLNEEQKELYAELSEDEKEELRELLQFKDDVSSDEWDDGIGFIRDEYFEDYARDFAEDIGAISKDTQWPATCIDWEQASTELQQDYSCVEFGDNTYWYR